MFYDDVLDAPDLRFYGLPLKEAWSVYCDPVDRAVLDFGLARLATEGVSSWLAKEVSKRKRACRKSFQARLEDGTVRLFGRNDPGLPIAHWIAEPLSNLAAWSDVHAYDLQGVDLLTAAKLHGVWTTGERKLLRLLPMMDQFPGVALPLASLLDFKNTKLVSGKLNATGIDPSGGRYAYRSPILSDAWDVSQVDWKQSSAYFGPDLILKVLVQQPMPLAISSAHSSQPKLEKSKKGRPPKYKWEIITAEIEDILIEWGIPNGQGGWYNLSWIENKIQEKFTDRNGDCPSRTSIQGYVKIAIEKKRRALQEKTLAVNGAA